MLKVGITGHLSGLGKELYTRIPNSVGFDIGTSRNKQIVNFDIKKPDPWIDELYKCDVFINNAYDGFHQVDMLGKVFMMWKEEDKLIINISSIAPEDRKNINYQMGFYPIHKKALDEACVMLQHIDKKCRIVNVKLGWMDTTSTQKVNADKMSVHDVATKIINVMNDKDITSITIEGPWQKIN